MRTHGRTHPFCLAALAIAALGLVTACGGDEEKPDAADTTPPSVVITDDVADDAAAGDVTFSFTFNEDVGDSFEAADVVVAGGAPGAFTRVASTLYRLVVTPESGTVGTVTVTVAAGAFEDLAGNASAAEASASQAFDTTVTLAQMTLPVTFDSATVDYGLIGFEGAEDSTIGLFDPADPANHVARVVRAATAMAWAGTTVSKADGAGFAEPLPFDADNTRMTVRVWSPDAGITVRLKAEDHADATVAVETEATTTAAGAWETLTFDFADAAAGTAALDLAKRYDKVSLFFHFGVGGATAGEKTYYFDDLVWLGGGGLVVEPGTFAALTFDDPAFSYAVLGFEGAEDSSLQADPDDAANRVVRVVKSGAAQPWAGTTVSSGPDATVGRIPFDAENTRLTVRVRSPDAGIQVRVKAEDHADPTTTVETEATTTAAGAWETLTFDFAHAAAGTPGLDVAKSYDKLTVFFNFGVGGGTAGEKVYYLDDLVWIGGGGLGGDPVPFADVTFDDTAVSYALTGFGGAEASTLVVDPSDAANHVAQVVKASWAETWAGTTVSTGENATVGKIPFDDTHTSLTVRVWSPDAGIPVRVKVEDHTDAAVSVETEATTTVANGWETLTFDFANQAAGTAALNPASTYDRLSIFFNFGTGGAVAGEKTYLFDDIRFVP